MDFKLHAPYSATGDQPEAIRKLTEGVRLGLDEQVLLGVTGSGKTFTMASVIANLNRPTLVLAHNKTLAAQLCSEFREFFPENAVEYFVSYYDYYQPEAYIAHTDTYIEKDSAINDEIERLRHSATSSLFERRDVIVVSSVSCIYGLGDPIDYKNMVISLRTGMEKSREELMQKLVEIRLRAKRPEFHPKHVPRARRYRGDLPRLLVRPGHPCGVLRRRDRPHLRDQRRQRHAGARHQPCGHLPRLALRRLAGQAQPRHPRDRARDGGA